MTFSAELLSVFALDAYNRGYGGGMPDPEFVADPGTALGEATIFLTSASLSIPGFPSLEDDSFYAIAYEIGGKIVISFRGMDNPQVDAQTGWPIGVGIPTVNQALYAIEFYKLVLAESGKTADDIVLTGHSLGGGLAGFVASLFGCEANVFDNMAFNLAAEAAYDIAGGTDPWSEIFSSAIYDDGELRWNYGDSALNWNYGDSALNCRNYGDSALNCRGPVGVRRPHHFCRSARHQSYGASCLRRPATLAEISPRAETGFHIAAWTSSS